MLFAKLLTLVVLSIGANVPPDFTVAADGTGDCTTIQEALDLVDPTLHERTIILVNDGVYREKIRVDVDCVTIRGQSREGTRIEFAQLNDDFVARPDKTGRAVINLNADDFVLENITVANTAGVVGQHAFAIYGKGDRTVIVDSDVLSDGADTLSLWNGDRGRYYHARCNLRGAVDFVCPRGWCYMEDCTFFETKTSAAMWHDGSKNQDQKFVLRNCQFDGVPGWSLARHHHDGSFYFLDCTFSNSMVNRAPYRVRYPLDGSKPLGADTAKNIELDKSNIWGERNYFFDCHRKGGDYSWMADNLATAPDAPTPADVTPAWTFGDTWNPESTARPRLVKITRNDGPHPVYTVHFSERVTAKGEPRLVLSNGVKLFCRNGEEKDTTRLSFCSDAEYGSPEIEAVRIEGGFIFASEAGATQRFADRSLPSVDAKQLSIALVGDSTVTDGSGWGLGFKKCVAEDVECTNFAQNGRSSKSFRDEGRWEPVLAAHPDYVLIQFGHNDQPGKGPEREAPADTAFRANMKRYVEEARAAGSEPILVTSLVRRKFGPDGKVTSDLTEYVDVVKEVAAETNAPLVDLHARSLELANSLGQEGCNKFNPTVDGKPDTTHLTRYGSDVIGRIVAEELARAVPQLKPQLVVNEGATTSP